MPPASKKSNDQQSALPPGESGYSVGSWMEPTRLATEQEQLAVEQIGNNSDSVHEVPTRRKSRSQRILQKSSTLLRSFTSKKSPNLTFSNHSSHEVSQTGEGVKHKQTKSLPPNSMHTRRLTEMIETNSGTETLCVATIRRLLANSDSADRDWSVCVNEQSLVDSDESFESVEEFPKEGWGGGSHSRCPPSQNDSWNHEENPAPNSKNCAKLTELSTTSNESFASRAPYQAIQTVRMPSPRDDNDGYHSSMHDNVDTSDRGGDDASTNNDANEATRPSASSPLAEDDASPYVVKLMPGWRRVGIDKKTVTFAGDVKKNGVIAIKDKNDDSGMGEEVETSRRLTFACYDVNEGGALSLEKENENSAIGDDNKRKEGTMPMVGKDTGRKIEDWDMEDVDEMNFRLTFIWNDVNEGGALAVEEANERSAMGEESEQNEGTPVVVEDDSGRSIADSAKTDGGTLEGSTDHDRPEPKRAAPTTLSPPPVEEDEPRPRMGWALLLLVFAVFIISILFLVFRE